MGGSISPNSHRVGPIRPTLFWRQIAHKTLSVKNSDQYAKGGELSLKFFFSECVFKKNITLKVHLNEIFLFSFFALIQHI